MAPAVRRRSRTADALGAARGARPRGSAGVRRGGGQAEDEQAEKQGPEPPCAHGADGTLGRHGGCSGPCKPRAPEVRARPMNTSTCAAVAPVRAARRRGRSGAGGHPPARGLLALLATASIGLRGVWRRRLAERELGAEGHILIAQADQQRSRRALACAHPASRRRCRRRPGLVLVSPRRLLSGHRRRAPSAACAGSRRRVRRPWAHGWRRLDRGPSLPAARGCDVPGTCRGTGRSRTGIRTGGAASRLPASGCPGSRRWGSNPPRGSPIRR